MPSRTFQILTAASLGMAVLLALLPEAGHDQLWLLLAAQRMGPHGNPYGPEVLESNPPLAIWLSWLAVAAARLLHLPVTAVFKAGVLLLIAASGAASLRLLRPMQQAETFPARSRSNLWLFPLVWTVVFAVLPARDFGQRDHLLVLLVMPYLVAAAPSLVQQKTSIRIAVTAAAALGLALKPHHAVIAIAVEALLLLKTRRLRVLEPAIFIAAGMFYLSAARILAPTYFLDVLPLLRDTYWAFGRLTHAQLVGAAPELHLLLVLTLALYFAGKSTGPLAPVLLTAGAAAMAGYHLQGTGWYYQQLPGLSLLVLALTLLLRQRASRWADGPSPGWVLPSAGAVSLLALGLTAYFSHFHPDHGRLLQPQPVPDPGFFRGQASGAPVATLTTSVDDTVPPAFRYDLTLAQRYPHLWLLPAILRNEFGPEPAHILAPGRLRELDTLQHRLMVEDLRRWKPVLILVERCQSPEVHCQVLEDRHDDLLAWFLRDPAFAAIFSRYEPAGSRGPYDAYRLRP